VSPTIDGKLKIDVQRLLKTRLLVQANSGGGKSYLLRRLLEQTAKEVQQIVIDVEGSFFTLREKFDFAICSPTGGDVAATPRTAKLLARKLMETGASAIIDISELKAHERKAFVRIFCESLVELPKKLWHPAMVVIDEIHLFAPEKGKSESSSAVIDLATRGRIRGLCMVGATQRLSKLSKDVAAELNNKLIGRTGLDIDVKRAADELGLSGKEAMYILRNMGEGEFFCFGPALSPTVERVKVGQVKTTHPEAGSGVLPKPPSPSKKMKNILGEFEDLTKEADHEARTIGELQSEVSRLKGAVTIANKKALKAGVPEPEVQRRIKTAVAEARKERPDPVNNHIDMKQIKKASVILNNIVSQSDQIHVQSSNTPARISVSSITPGTVDGLRKGAVRILQELAARYPAGYTKSQVGALTRFSPKGGTFGTYMSDLRKGGFIEERDKLIYSTENGIESLGDKVPSAPTSHEEAMGLWRQALRAGAYRMLEVIVGAGEVGISRDDIAIQVGMTKTGGTFSTYLSDLRRNSLMSENNGMAIANDILFPA
jgi:hypothetical protein